MAEATIMAACEEVGNQIEPVRAAVKGHLIQTPDPVHLDETGMRIEGKLRWDRVASTGEVTYLEAHENRGAKALAEIGIYPDRQGPVVHDG
jgi:transposase